VDNNEGTTEGTERSGEHRKLMLEFNCEVQQCEQAAGSRIRPALE